MKKFFKKLVDEKGATAVEYALMVTLIALAIITAVSLVGTNLAGVFDTVASTLTSAPISAPTGS